ncbi:uncharacterized [Tachysurus ichikawai]
MDAAAHTNRKLSLALKVFAARNEFTRLPAVTAGHGRHDNRGTETTTSTYQLDERLPDRFNSQNVLEVKLS